MFLSISNAVEHSAAPGSIIKRAQLFVIVALPKNTRIWLSTDSESKKVEFG